MRLLIFLTVGGCFSSLPALGQQPSPLKPPAASKGESALSPKIDLQSKEQNPFAKSRLLNPAGTEERGSNDLKRKLEKLRPEKSLLEKDGGVSDGGSGTGEVCFKAYNEQTGVFDNNLALRAIDEEGKIREGYRSQIRWLTLTEESESLIEDRELGGLAGQSLSLYPALPGETPETYLQRIIETKIQPLSPLFADHLHRALQATDPKNWIPVPEGLKRIPDLGTTPGIHGTILETMRNLCRKVQIVRRMDHPPSEATGYSASVARIEYDPDLYERLISISEIADKSNPTKGVVAKAALWMHEALYALGVQLGHQNSVPARFATRALLSNMTYIMGVKTSFEFLWMLDSLGYLSPEFFGYENLSSSSPDYQRLETLAHVFRVLHNAERNKNSRFQNSFCDRMQEKWPDMDCHFLTAHDKRQFEFFWSNYLSPQQILDESDAFSWTFFSALLSYTQKDSYFESLFQPDVVSSKRLQSQCKWISGLEKYASRLSPVYFLIPNPDLKEQMTPERVVKQNRLLPLKSNKFCEELKRSRIF